MFLTFLGYYSSYKKLGEAYNKHTYLILKLLTYFGLKYFDKNKITFIK